MNLQVVCFIVQRKVKIKVRLEQFLKIARISKYWRHTESFCTLSTGATQRTVGYTTTRYEVWYTRPTTILIHVPYVKARVCRLSSDEQTLEKSSKPPGGRIYASPYPLHGSGSLACRLGTPIPR